MKFIRLSSVVLMSVLTLNSGVAMSKGVDQTPGPTSSVQTEPLQTEPLIMANIFFDLRNPFQTIIRVLTSEERRKAREQKVQELKQARERERQQLEVARREATEQQRLEAEQRQKYFESLSPEEKKAYLAEQRARREQADQTASLFLLMLLGGAFGSGDSGSDQSKQNDPCEFYVPPTSGSGGTMAQGNPCR